MNKTGFKDPAELKNPEQKGRDPWSFTCPTYDERTSCFINAGTHYGKGINQPVGHMGNPKSTTVFPPKGRVDTLKIHDVPPKTDKIYDTSKST
jgi:hypothetical protein